MLSCLKILASLLLSFYIGGCSLGQAPATQTSVKRLPGRTCQVTAPRTGQIIGLIAEPGERISQGQPLFALADAEVDQQCAKIATTIAAEQAKLKVMETGTPATADLSALEAQQGTAKQKAAKMEMLFAQGAVSRRQAEAAQQELQQAERALQAAKQQPQNALPSSPEAISAQKQKLAKLGEEQQLWLAKQQANEIICPATGIVKEILLSNGTEVQQDQVVLKLEITEE